MKPTQYLKVAASIALGGVLSAQSATAQITLQPIGTYASGVFDEGAAEIVAHDSRKQQLFVVNAAAATVDVLDIKNPASPVKVATIDVSPYGALANSVAVKDGVLAVAVENANKQANGRVVFFATSNFKFQSSVEVGALPDMVTFSDCGRWVLVANEGEPEGYEPGQVDPEGSVSIIDLKKGAKKLKQADVRTAGFTAFNGATLDPSIRIFGPNATVAQDLEPEYIAISADCKTAFVTCQENNALAIVDIPSATVTALKGLGFKNHGQVDAELQSYTLPSLPLLGATPAGQDVFLGGLSGLFFEGTKPDGTLMFVANTDRGPNGEPTGSLRPFLLPDFAPELVRLELTPAGVFSITQRISLQDKTGTPLTGLPNTSVMGGTASSPHNDEIPVDLLGNVLPLDALGGDFEGVVIDANGTFWLCDEYRPALYNFDATGKLIERYVPAGTAAAAGQPVGTFGVEALPSVLAQRRQNRGFEAIAYADGKIYAWVQSPLRNPVSSSNGALNGRQVCRMVEFDPATMATRQFAYTLDNPNLGTPDNTRADKIGDAVALGGGEFLVVERDDDAIDSDPASNIEKKIYRISIVGATDISGLGTIGMTGKLVDELTAVELAANGVRAVSKVLHVDLNAAGYNAVEKVEGLALIDMGRIAVINDNDFGVAGITLNGDGTFIPDPAPEPVVLGIIDLDFAGLDASDRDGLVNIRQWPVHGIFMPDGIASFRTLWGEFLITANEGDAREYDGLEEEARVGSSSVVLDPAAFPFGPSLKRNEQLGRLNITRTLGDTDNDGDLDHLFSFGTRSFTIWKRDGTLVYDSRDDIEQTIAADPALRPYFNASNDDNNFESRSDNKGPEPEGVAVGRVGFRTYAFVGLERVGGLYVVDVTNPYRPRFVQYVNNRDFTQPPSMEVNGVDVPNPAAGDLGPEGIVFIAAKDSPNRKPLVVVGNEVSGTTTIYQVNGPKFPWFDFGHGNDDDRGRGRGRN